MKNEVFKLIEQAENGDIGMLEAATSLQDIKGELDFLSKSIKAWIDENIEELSMTASSYPEGFAGYQFEYRSGAKRWDFKKCPTWSSLKNDLTLEEQKLKAAFDSVQKGLAVGTEDGEEIVLPELKYNKPSLIFKLMRRG